VKKFQKIQKKVLEKHKTYVFRYLTVDFVLKNYYISSINPEHILSMHCEWRYDFSEVRELAPLPMIAVKI